VEKKMMRKRGGRMIEAGWRWKRKRIKEEKKFKYLGYVL